MKNKDPYKSDLEKERPLTNEITFNGQLYRPVINEAHSSLVMEKNMPELLVGKWVKCVDDWIGESLILDEWYPITDVSDSGNIQVKLAREIYFAPHRFDLTDPRDEKPLMEKRIPFDWSRVESCDYLRIETMEGKKVSKLVNFKSTKWPLCGIVEGNTTPLLWKLDGSYGYQSSGCAYDLTLIVRTSN